MGKRHYTQEQRNARAFRAQLANGFHRTIGRAQWLRHIGCGNLTRTARNEQEAALFRIDVRLARVNDGLILWEFDDGEITFTSADQTGRKIIPGSIEWWYLQRTALKTSYYSALVNWLRRAPTTPGAEVKYRDRHMMPRYEAGSEFDLDGGLRLS